VARRKLRLTYASRAGERTERLVDPWGLVDKDDVWYLVAGTERGQRTFRVDRIVDVVVTDDEAEHPADLDLGAEWDRVVEEVEQRRSQTWATVLVETRFTAVLRGRFGRYCEIEGLDDDGRTRARVAADTPLSLARNLAGWGAHVEVVEPAPVRAELARLGAELVERYAR
jgi:predicted DNA-binding transcriptional regulator YafY